MGPGSSSANCTYSRDLLLTECCRENMLCQAAKLPSNRLPKADEAKTAKPSMRVQPDHLVRQNPLTRQSPQPDRDISGQPRGIPERARASVESSAVGRVSHPLPITVTGDKPEVAGKPRLQPREGGLEGPRSGGPSVLTFSLSRFEETGPAEAIEYYGTRCSEIVR